MLGADRSKRIMKNVADPFETIVREHYDPLFKFAMSLTRVDSEARDLTQQTFYVWATKGHQLRDASKVKTWLFTTLHRAFLGARRRQSRFIHHQLEEVSEQALAVYPLRSDPSDSAQALSALAKVDEVYQGAVALFYLQDCSYKDIAAILEVPVGTVKSRIARGIGQLRQILLADNSRASSCPPNGVAVRAIPREPGAPPGDAFASAPGQAVSAAAAEGHDQGYEWDSSSSGLREPLTAA